MGNVLMAAGQKVEIIKGQTWLEAIHGGNRDKRTIKPNSFYNAVLLEKDRQGNLTPIPQGIVDARPLYTGTAGLIGAKGRPLGVGIEAQCECLGSMKTVIGSIDAQYAGLVDHIVACDHGFAPDNTPFIQLINAKTGKPITTDEEMREASEVLIKLNGKIYLLPVKSRDGGVLEVFNGENNFSWVTDSAVLGLLRRSYDNFGIDDRGRCVGLDVLPSGRLSVVMETAGGSPEKSASLAVRQAEHAPLEATAQKLIPEIIEGGVILRGSDEQVQAILRLGRSNNLI